MVIEIELNKMDKDVIDCFVVKIEGVDLEKEDRAVGIFGNDFCIVTKTEDRKQLQISMGDDEAYLLYKELKKKLIEARIYEMEDE